MPYALAYLASFVTFMAMDACWLTLTNARLYRPAIGPLLADKIDMLPAVLFYLIYLGGITVLVTVPSAREGGVRKAAITGAILGFVAYATYDLTNAATLRMWSWTITGADMAWGTLVTAAAAAAGSAVLIRIKGPVSGVTPQP
jgi:uncharacterized membrane protein